jgi:hypothetical protein
MNFKSHLRNEPIFQRRVPMCLGSDSTNFQFLKRLAFIIPFE